MSKNNPKLQIRDWALIVLFVALIGTNWAWYQTAQDLDVADRSNSSLWLLHQAEISKLKTCINENIRPCDDSVPPGN